MKYTFLLPAYKVIISDDCSPEDLRSICEPYLADPRFTYRRNAENLI